MNRKQQQAWQREAIDMAFRALAGSRELSETLVYKGACVLALRLGGNQRASYDLDANLLHTFTQRYPDRQSQRLKLEELIQNAITEYIETQDPIRFELQSIRVDPTPPNDHPRGWNAFKVIVRLRDRQNDGVLGLPRVDFDVAAPEELGIHATAPLNLGDGEVFAYTLERIAGEKMRAFLYSLPAHQRKKNSRRDTVRVKDLYDVARILQKYPLTVADFWTTAGHEFQIACRSRFVDCSGIEAFSEELDVTRATYERDATLPKDIEFNAAWTAVQAIVTFWADAQCLPFNHPAPAVHD